MWHHISVVDDDDNEMKASRASLEINGGDPVKLRITTIDEKPIVREFFVERITIETKEDLESKPDIKANSHREKIATFKVDKAGFAQRRFEDVSTLFDKAMEAARGRRPEDLSLEQPVDKNGYPIEEEKYVIFNLYAR